MEINVHIHFGNEEKYNKILEAIEKWHEAEVREMISMVKEAIKDLSSTPTE